MRFYNLKNNVHRIVGSGICLSCYEFDNYIKVIYYGKEDTEIVYIKRKYLDELKKYKQPTRAFKYAKEHDIACGEYNKDYENMFIKYVIDNDLGEKTLF